MRLRGSDRPVPAGVRPSRHRPRRSPDRWGTEPRARCWWGPGRRSHCQRRRCRRHRAGTTGAGLAPAARQPAWSSRSEQRAVPGCGARGQRRWPGCSGTAPGRASRSTDRTCSCPGSTDPWGRRRRQWRARCRRHCPCRRCSRRWRTMRPSPGRSRRHCSRGGTRRPLRSRRCCCSRSGSSAWSRRDLRSRWDCCSRCRRPARSSANWARWCSSW